MRRALENLAVQLACLRMSPQTLADLKAAARAFEEILGGEDVTAVAEADVAFHDVIYMATDNQRLISLLNNLREQMYRYRVEERMPQTAFMGTSGDHPCDRSRGDRRGDKDHGTAYRQSGGGGERCTAPSGGKSVPACIIRHRRAILPLSERNTMEGVVTYAWKEK